MSRPPAPNGQRRRRPLRAAAVALALVSVVPLAHGLYLPAKAATAQLLLEATWRLGRASGDDPMRPWPWADTHAVARLTAPDHGVSLIVLAGASGRTLAFGPGHVAGTAPPGSDGHVAIAGHRDTHFAFLADLEPGDELVLEALDGTPRRYRVVETAVVDKERGDLLAPSVSATPTLTLVTCYPFDTVTAGGPLRFLVRAREVPEGLAPAADGRPSDAAV